MPLPPEVAMRRVVAMLVLPLASLAGQQQPQQLGIHYEHSSQYEANELELPKAIRQLGESIRLRIRSGAAPRFAGVRDTTFEYSTPCDSIKPPAIVASSPAKFIDCQRKL